jgi:hypothetical protein
LRARRGLLARCHRVEVSKFDTLRDRRRQEEMSFTRTRNAAADGPSNAAAWKRVAVKWKSSGREILLSPVRA